VFCNTLREGPDGRMKGSHHIREFLRAMKMMRKEAMMKMAFFRASYAPTIFSLSCRGKESACVCGKHESEIPQIHTE